MQERSNIQKPVIKEVVVVEGIQDKQAVDRAVIADCIMTRGAALDELTMKMIERAAATRGVIIFTDPDYVGEDLRKKIARRINNSKHAFLTQKQARKGTDIGIENAKPSAIISALSAARELKMEPEQRYESQRIVTDKSKSEVVAIPWEWMLQNRLVASADSAQRRLALADELGIGYANGKQFWRRLVMLEISKDEFLQAMKRVAASKL